MLVNENEQIKQLLYSISINDDRLAYKELFIQLHFRLKQFAYSILKSNEESEELVSDIFIGIWEKRANLTSIESPILYFFTAAKNHAFNRLSKLKKIRNLNQEEWLIQCQGIYLDPEQLMLTNEMIKQIKKAVNELPPRCKLIFKLIKEDGLKYREVAELLQLSVKTIEAQMAIALRRIGKCMHMDLKSTPYSISK